MNTRQRMRRRRQRLESCASSELEGFQASWRSCLAVWCRSLREGPELALGRDWEPIGSTADRIERILCELRGYRRDGQAEFWDRLERQTRAALRRACRRNRDRAVAVQRQLVPTLGPGRPSKIVGAFGVGKAPELERIPRATRPPRSATSFARSC